LSAVRWQASAIGSIVREYTAPRSDVVTANDATPLVVVIVVVACVVVAVAVSNAAAEA
jgi:hypothetical protein